MSEDEIRPAEDEARTIHLPADDLIRASVGHFVLRDTDEGTMPILEGHGAVFRQWTRIDSMSEGLFMERVMPGAFTKTLAEATPKILFQHGRDPQIGDKVLAPTEYAGEDADGVVYRGRMFDTTYNRDLVPGLAAGVYGSSFRFSVVRGKDAIPAKRDAEGNYPDYNPEGLPERTIREVKLMEMGPVTWPAYPGADAGLRSLTDRFALQRLAANPERLGELVEEITEDIAEKSQATPEPAPAQATPEPAPTDAPPKRVASKPTHTRKEPTVADINDYPTRDEKVARVAEIEREMETLDKQFDGVLPDEPQARWDSYTAEKAALTAAIAAVDRRRAELSNRWTSLQGQSEPTFGNVNVIKTRDLASIYDVRRIERESRDVADRSQNLRDNAMRAIEGAAFQNARFPKQSGQSDVASLLDGRDQCEPDEVAKRVLYTGKPAYRRAFRKYLLGQTFTVEEQAAFEEARASLVTLANTAVPFDLDTTMAIDLPGGVNPYREAFRVVKTTSNDWRPMVSSGMVAAYVAEATAGSEAAPSFTAPARTLQKAHTVAKFSVEIQGDYPGLEAELTREIADSKNTLESVQFTTGAGTTVYPQGIFTFWTANFLDTATTLVIVPKDIYAIEAWMGPRYRANSVWLGSPYFYSLVRAIDTAGGAGLWIDNLTQGGGIGNIENGGRLGNLVGHPAYEVGGLPADMATTAKVAGLFNRERFVIIDRIGMNIELIPNFLSASTGYPTGERMVYAWWRNTSCGIGTATLTTGEAGVIFRGK